MTEFYDQLETRSSDARAAAQLAALRAQLEHAKSNTTAYADTLAEIDTESIIDFESFARLPLTRKSELLALQAEHRPFGGYTSANAAQLTHVFASPGPIYEPGFAVGDFWRFARSLYASGFRRGDRRPGAQLLQLPFHSSRADVRQRGAGARLHGNTRRCRPDRAAAANHCRPGAERLCRYALVSQNHTRAGR
jgi:hypothetical protein